MTDATVGVGFRADTAPLDAGVTEVKGQLNSLKAMVDGMRANFAGLASSVKASFAGVGNAVHGVTQGTKEAAEGVQHMLGPIQAMRDALGGAGEALIAAFAVKELIDFAKQMAETAEQIDHTAITFGLTTGAIQKMRAEAAGFGVPAEAMTTAMMRLDRAMAAAKQGSTQAANAFKEIGVNIRDPMTQTQLWNTTLEKFGQMEAGPAKVAAAMALFGRNIQAIGPILGMTKEQLAEVSQAIDDYGIANDDAEQKGLALADAMNVNKIASQGLGNVFAQALAPVMTEIVRGINGLIKGFIESYKHGGIAKTVMQALSVTLKILATIFVSLWVACLPFVAILEVLIGLVKALADAFQGHFQAAAADMSHALDQVANSARNAARDMEFLKNIWGAGGPATKLPALPKAGGGTTADDLSKAPRAKKGAQGPSELDQWREELAAKLLLEQNWGADEARLTLQFWEAKLATIKGESAKEKKLRLEVQQDINKAQKAVYDEDRREALAAMQAKLAIDTEDAKNAVEINKLKIQTAIDEVTEKEKLGEISAQSAIAQRSALNESLLRLDMQEADRERDLKLAELRNELNDQHLKVADRNRINREIEAAEAQHDNRMKLLSAQLAKQEVDDARNAAEQAASYAHTWVDPVVNAWTQGLKGMLTHTESWGKAIRSIGEAVVDRMIQALSKWVANWIVKHLAMTAFQRAQALIQTIIHGTSQTAQAAATTISQTTQTAAVSFGSGAQAAAEKVAAAARVATLVGLAGAGGVASMAAAPFPIDTTAPAFGQAMAMAAAAFGSVASAAGGWDRVPSDQLAMIHKDEMVLPSAIASPLRSALAGIGGGGASAMLGSASAAGASARESHSNSTSTSNLHYAPNITNPEPDLMKQLDRQSTEFLKFIRKAQRNNKLPRGK